MRKKVSVYIKHCRPHVKPSGSSSHISSTSSSSSSTSSIGIFFFFFSSSAALNLRPSISSRRPQMRRNRRDFLSAPHRPSLSALWAAPRRRVQQRVRLLQTCGVLDWARRVEIARRSYATSSLPWPPRALSVSRSGDKCVRAA